MDQRAAKLKALGVSEEAAEALVDAGIDTPRKIRSAKAADLKAVNADGDVKVKDLRKKR